MCASPRPAVWRPATELRLALVAYGAALGALLAAGLWRTGGTFTYPLDDPAIHLTVARRLAYDGTWGVVAGQYQAASSSPLWEYEDRLPGSVEVSYNELAPLAAEMWKQSHP